MFTKLVTSSSRGLFSKSKARFHTSSPALARILCTDNIDRVCVEVFEKAGHVVDEKHGLSASELAGIIKHYDGLVVRSSSRVTGDLLDKASNLKVVGRAGVGIDNIDVTEATRRGVLVMNTPGGNTISAAELTMSLVCALARNIPSAAASMRAGNWDRNNFTGVELQGKTIAIVGLGRIGRMVARWAQGFGMRTIGYDPVISDAVAREDGIEKMTLEELYPLADFITLHTPLTEQTRNLLNEDTLSRCRDGVRIVNCARGGIIDETALLQALESGKVAGAALDVYSTEPPPAEVMPLLRHDRVICTPHLGASTEEAQMNVAKQVAVQMCDTLAGRSYMGVVNAGHMELSANPHMTPFLTLAGSLGRLLAELAPGAVREMNIASQGGLDIDITTPSARSVLQAAMLQGALTFIRPGVHTNLVSAPFLAKEASVLSKIDVAGLVRPDLTSTPYKNVMKATAVTTTGQQVSVEGVVFGKEPFVVKIDDYSGFQTFRPEGTLIMFTNEDTPGVVAGVLEVLALAGINVASFTLGRHTGDGLPMGIVIVDGEITKAVENQLSAVGHVHTLKVAHLGGSFLGTK